MPKISVIIPAYNAEKTIAETIKSVQKQTFSDFELIVINDGSKDRTVEIVESIQDERLKIFSYENGGLPVARNRGISQATGEFIAFLDADDLWTADKLERQLIALEENPEAGVAYSWTCFMDVDEQGKPLSFLPSPRYAFTGNVYEKLLVSDFIHNGSNTLIRRQALESTGGFDPACPGCADWDYWLRLSTRWDFVVIPKHQILYRRTPGAMSSKVEQMKEAALIAMKKAYQAAPPELQYLKRYTMVSFHIYFAGLYLQHRSDTNSVSQAHQHIWSAIRLNPQVLLDTTTQKLIIKLLLKLVLPTQLANYFLQLVKKPLTLSDPRLEA
ncbi:glycosyltransferase [Nostoc sp. FACHB-152]|uniref:glycosyltransferase family 2 protein n=1 Tax=unclassified Nostoc TaxID=2593658 RepID=UPI0016882E78|nr:MULTISPECIES: glycosyltransferase [unclassified Nostoc]MBD2449488.1 glycosyltransferase [Nostoc sp. FACHB-152]MBD2470295.1 glycosyltransferase [Nostoc sp. FACHB-145]